MPGWMNFFAEADPADQKNSDKISQTVVVEDLLFIVIYFGVVWLFLGLLPKQKFPSAGGRTRGIIDFNIAKSQ